MGSLALLRWYALCGVGGGPYLPSCALGSTPGPLSPHLRGTNTLLPTRTSPSPLLSAPPCLICAARDQFPAQVLHPQAGLLSLVPVSRICCSALSLWSQGLMYVRAVPEGAALWARSSSPSFSHCELSIRVSWEHTLQHLLGFYTTLISLFIVCGKGRIARRQRGEPAALSLEGLCLSCHPGSTLCSLFFLAQDGENTC